MSGVIEDAVSKHMGGDHNWDVLYRRLDRHTRALVRLQRDQDIMLEAFAVYVQLWFAHTPALPGSQQDAAKREAWERFQKYSSYVAAQVAGGKRFVDDLARAPDEDDKTDPGVSLEKLEPRGGE